MTHKDIYVKFMIEYDKANITSSYPSLTEYEIATILDKAYLALIAQKLTGNNQRKVGFEADIKAIEDLRPLVVTKKIQESDGRYAQADNDKVYSLHNIKDFLYYISSIMTRGINPLSSIDKKSHNLLPVQLLDHNYATKFMATDYNLPWIKNPVAYIENDYVHVLVDAYKLRNDSYDDLSITYIKKPAKFALIENKQEEDPEDVPGVFILNISKLNSNDKIQ